MKLRTISLWLMIALACAGCAKEKQVASAHAEDADTLPTGTRWASFPVELSADPGFLAVPGAEDDLRLAMDFWEDRAGRDLFRYEGPRRTWRGGRPYARHGRHQRLAGNVIYLEHDWPRDGENDGRKGLTLLNFSGGRIENGVVLIQPPPPAPKTCEGCAPLVPLLLQRRALLAHELGHFIGLPHTTEEGNIMAPVLEGNLLDLDDYKVDRAALRALTR